MRILNGTNCRNTFCSGKVLKCLLASAICWRLLPPCARFFNARVVEAILKTSNTIDNAALLSIYVLCARIVQCHWLGLAFVWALCPVSSTLLIHAINFQQGLGLEIQEVFSTSLTHFCSSILWRIYRCASDHYPAWNEHLQDRCRQQKEARFLPKFGFT